MTVDAPRYLHLFGLRPDRTSASRSILGGATKSLRPVDGLRLTVIAPKAGG